MTATNVSIIKSDRRARLRYTPDQREALVKACQASGLPAMKASEAASLTPANWHKARSGKAQRQAA